MFSGLDPHLIKYKSLHRFRHLRSGSIEDLISSVDENMPVVDWLKNHCGRGRRAIQDIAVIFSDKRKEYKVKDIVTAAHFDRLFQILDPRGYYEMKEQKKQDAFVARMTERGN